MGDNNTTARDVQQTEARNYSELDIAYRQMCAHLVAPPNKQQEIPNNIFLVFLFQPLRFTNQTRGSGDRFPTSMVLIDLVGDRFPTSMVLMGHVGANSLQA